MKEGWEIKSFEDCIEKVCYSNKIKKNRFKESGNFPIISQEVDFINGYWDKEEDLFKLRKPVVIFGDHTKIFKFVDFNFVIGADGIKILETNNQIDPKYFYYYLQSVKLKDLGYARHYRLLKETKIKFPSVLSEQKRIVSILDKAFDAIEKAKANAEENLKNSKELFESYLNNIFVNKGDDWEERKMGDVYDVRDGTHDSPKYQKEGFPLITSKNLKNYELNYNNVRYITEKDYKDINKRSKVDKGDILFAMIGTIGNPVVIEEEPNFAIKNVALFKMGRNQNPYFLKYFLDSEPTKNKMRRESKGTTQQFVGLGYLRDFPILIPSLEEQITIVDQLDLLRAKTQKLEEVYRKKITDLEEMKKSFLQKAFNGEL